MDEIPFRISMLRGHARWFVTFFIVTITLGYLTGSYFVLFTTSGTPHGMVQEFRGNEEKPLEEAETIKFEKTPGEMLNIIHAHTTSFALIFLTVGGLFLFTSYVPKLKAMLTVEPFVATLVLFGGMAGMRYLPETWSIPLGVTMLLAGVSTFLAVTLMSTLLLWEMWRP